VSGLSFGTPGTYTLTASLGGQAAVSTAPFTISAAPDKNPVPTPAAPTAFRFLASPSVGTPGHSLPLLRVVLIDAHGNIVRKAGVLVTVHLSHGKLHGTVHVRTDAHGFAT